MQYVGAVTATLSNAAVATYSTWPSPVLSLLQSEDSPLSRPISDDEGSWVVSLAKLAILPAAVVAAWMVESIGRKKSLLIAGVLLFIPWFLVMFGTNIWVLYAARFMGGLGNGIVVVGCSIYNGEISEKDIRGRLSSTLIILKLVGALLVLCIGPYVSYTVLAIVCAIIPIIFVALYVFMPESPYYLVKINQKEQAEKNLRILSSNLVDDKFITDRIMEIERSVEEDMKNKTTLWEFMTNSEYRMAIIIMFGVKTLQQLSGEAAIDAYMQPIVASTGSTISEETSSIIFGIVQLPGALLAGYLVDKIGRKPLLIVSATGCAVALFAEGTYFFFQNVLENDVSSISWLPTTGIAIFVFMINLGVVTLPYVLLGELFPTNIKGIGVSTFTLYGAALAFVVSKFFKPLANAWGEHTVFWIFGCICVLGVIFVLTVLPETKGKSFSEIQAVLKKKSSKEDVETTLSNAGSATYSIWPSPTLALLQSEDSPVGRPITDDEGSWVVSLTKLAKIVVALFGGFMVEKIGRKKSLLIAGVLLFLPWFLVIFGKNIGLLYTARFIGGLGGGIVIVGCSIYNGEIADKDIRGKLSSTLIILKLVGSLLILCIGPYVSYTVLAIVCAIIPVVFVSIFVFMPESPYYLVKIKENDQAEKNLRILSGNLVSDKDIKAKVYEIERSVESDMQNKTTLWEFISNKDYRKAIIIILGVKTLQQLSGEAAIDAYMQPIIASTGSNISEEISSIIFGVVQLPGALLASYLVDKIGRKPLLIISATGCAIAMFAEGTYFYIQDVVEADVSSIAWLPTIGIAVFVFMHNLGIVTLPYVLLGELFPTNIKGIAVSLGTVYGSSLAFIVSKFFKPLANAWGEYTVFWIFGTVCIMGIIFVLLVLPETKGKSFAEIQAVLRKQPISEDVETTLSNAAATAYVVWPSPVLSLLKSDDSPLGTPITDACSIYAGEIAEKDIRGKLTSAFAILKLAGSLLVLCVGPYASYNVLAIACSSLPLLFVCTYAFMPESPYYLVKIKRNEEAEKNLRILSSKTADDKFIERSMMEIEQSIEEDMKNRTTIWEFLSNKDYRPAILIMFGIKSLQQLSGESAIDGYMQPIIEATGSNISPELSSIIFGLVQIPGVLLASYLVDTLGRRPLLVISSTGCAIALFAEGTYFYLQNKLEADVSGIGWLPTLALAFFVFMLNLGIVTLPYVLAGELFPANIKGIASAAISLYSAVLAFLVSKFFKPISNAWGEHTVFWAFGSVCIIGIIFGPTMLPETKGKSFSEIQAMLKKSPKNNDVAKEEIETKV
ncbi:sugar transporter-like [Holotrichia oblita]|uniref:Sugar transporter-like n=1 Tax=Holotrichia oblita TaxID=644536 RepID=A0ACB9SSG7_HOLOL|nr:sugar transporter-like [Holotrichia oblita]